MNKFLKKASLVFRSGFVIYGVLFLLLTRFIDYDVLQLKSLNRARPSHIRYLHQVAHGTEGYDEEKFRAHVNYLNTIIQVFPERFEAYGLLGYCALMKNDLSKAESLYKKSIAIEDDFFWTQYNLAVLYYNQERFDEAISLLKNIIQISPEAVLEIIFSSKQIYVPQFNSEGASGVEVLLREYRAGYLNCFKMLIVSLFKQKQYAQILGLTFEGGLSSLSEPGFFDYYAGCAAYELKNFQKSVYFFKKSLEADPNNYQAAIKLSEIFVLMRQEKLASLFKQQSKKIIDKVSLYDYEFSQLKYQVY